MGPDRYHNQPVRLAAIVFSALHPYKLWPLSMADPDESKARGDAQWWARQHQEAKRLSDLLDVATNEAAANALIDEYYKLWEEGVEEATLELQDQQLVPLLLTPHENAYYTNSEVYAKYYSSVALRRWLHGGHGAPLDVDAIRQAVLVWTRTAPPVLRALFRVLSDSDASLNTRIALRDLTNWPFLRHVEYERVMLTILQAAKQVLAEDEPGEAHDLHEVWNNLPVFFTGTAEQHFPMLWQFYLTDVLTGEEREVRRQEAEARARLDARVAQLEANVADVPDLSLLERAQIDIAALKLAEDDAVEADYEDLLNNDVFPALTLQTQSDALQYLPPIADLVSNAVLLRTVLGLLPLSSYFLQVMRRLLLQPPFTHWTPAGVQEYIQHGGPLLRYLLTVRLLLRKLVYGREDNALGNALLDYICEHIQYSIYDRGSTREHFTYQGMLDTLLVWIIREADAAIAQARVAVPALATIPPLDLLAVRASLTSWPFLANPETHEFLPGLFPQLSALLDPLWRESLRVQREQQLAAAAQAFSRRVRAKRRLSLAVPVFLPPPGFPPAAPGGGGSRNGGATGRRPSSVVSVQTPTPALLAFLRQQAAADEAVVAALPIVSPSVRQWARRRASLRAGAARRGLPAEEAQEEVKNQAPSLRNCVDFGTRRCSNDTNLAGFNWCAVPESFWWGPIGPARQCYDLRELLIRFGNQVIDIPSVPRPSHPFSYPDGRPVTENMVKSMMEVARARNHPIPWELQVYFAGQAVKRQAPLVPAGVGRFTSDELRRIQEREPYAVVAEALAAQEDAIAREIQAGYSGFDEGQPEGGEAE